MLVGIIIIKIYYQFNITILILFSFNLRLSRLKI